jgi:prepilin-type N-terminal cleavage/methylation domain-containing protein
LRRGVLRNVCSGIQGDDGVSLLELIIVLAVIGLLAVIAVPSFSSSRDRARMATLFEAGDSARSALTALAADDVQSLYPPSVTIDTLKAGGASLPDSGYTLTYAPTGTPARSSYTLLLEDSPTGNQVCVTPKRTQKTAAGVCS